MARTLIVSRRTKPAGDPGVAERQSLAARATRGTADNQPEHAMKIVMAIIKPFKLDEVRDALTAVGVRA